MELEADVGDVKGLFEAEGEVDLVGPLDPFVHRLRLPPGLVVTRGEVREGGGGVVEAGVTGVTDVTGSFEPKGPCLDAVLNGARFPASARHFHLLLERSVLELGNAFLEIK